MASFKALNIESDDELDDEPDDTKEIQIEDALKIYQTALKNHSQGSKTLKEAGEAYATLFESEIFKYPESQSEFRREEALGEQQAANGVVLGEIEFVTAAPTSNAENASNALPQILHLSYKNRGQYHLDLLETILYPKQLPQDDSTDQENLRHVETRKAAFKALNDFAEALDKDEEDADLWRRAARVGETLASERVARYCLEGVLDEDEESLQDIFGVPAIEKTLSQQDLKKLTERLNDSLSLAQMLEPPHVPSAWKKQLELYPFLPASGSSLVKATSSQGAFEAEPLVIKVTELTWNGVGQLILQCLRDEQTGLISRKSRATVELSFPLDKIVVKASPNSHAAGVTQSPKSPVVSHTGKVAPLTELPGENPPAEEAARPNTPHEELTRVKSNGAESVVQKSLPDRTSQLDGGSSGQEREKPSAAARKRSSEAAELPENPEGGRGRSKRLRARTSLIEDLQPAEGKALESMSDYEWKINQSMFADGGLFEVLGDITRRLGIDVIKSAKELRDVISTRPLTTPSQERKITPPLSQAMLDFYALMQKWNESAAAILLRSKPIENAEDTSQKTGFLTFLEQSKTRSAAPAISDFQLDINSWLVEVSGRKGSIDDMAMSFIYSIMDSSDTLSPDQTGKVWSEALKQTLVQMTVCMNDYMLERLSQDRYSEDEQASTAKERKFDAQHLKVAEFVQSLFELHLDVYTRITNPVSEVDVETRMLQKARLDSWCNLAREFVNDHITIARQDIESPRLDTLTLRHLWASVFHLAASDTVGQEHLVLCLTDLKREFALRGSPIIYLPNNAVSPELSISAADREISKLKTTDFFLRVSQTEGKSPVDQIEDLEPLLEEAALESQEIDNAAGEHDSSAKFQAVVNSPERSSPIQSSLRSGETQRSSQQLLSQFLREADVSLRLLLWRRLSDAYETIDYPPKVLLISLRSIQLLMEELKRPTYAQKKKEDREKELLDTVRDCGELVIKALAITDTNANALDCLDDKYLRSMIKALIDWWNILYTVALFDDYSQAGQKGGSLMNPFRFYPLENFHQASIRLHDMQVQCSILLYKLITEAMNQMPEGFPNPVDDKLQYLRNVHWVFGVRRLCKASDSELLKFTKDELLKLPDLTRQSSDDLAQVLYDLYELHCFSTPLERLEHGCDVDYLDKPTALQLVDFVMGKVKRSNIKELLKSDLGKTVDKIHNALGGIKNTSFIGSRNRKFFNNFLRSPIRPLDLFRSVNGVGELSAVPMTSDDGVIASKRWYFLKGQMALAKFKSQKSKSVQASEEDLNAAILFFSHDLEFYPDHWESWFRMAQAYDTLLEEHVLWSAEKLNNHQTDLCQTQRAAIHAYAIATACMLKTPDVSAEQIPTLAELYADFGTRIYASSSQPFAMRAFSTRDFPEKHFSDERAVGGKYTTRPFRSLKHLGAWKLSRALLQKALSLEPHNWVNYYMLAKCLWKIYQKSDRIIRTELIAVIKETLCNAIELLPTRKDPSRQDPVLEPIYKTVSFAYKMVVRGDLNGESGAEMIETCLTKQKQFDVSKVPQLSDFNNWPLYVLDILRLIRAADKSRWHHRVVFRAARIMHKLYDNVADGARRAKEYLTEQHLYSTKTLTLTVWKPENERPGRHYYYTRQYALFMARIFEETDDLESIETLARRIRKKPNEFYEHTSLWEEVCLLHLKLHRRYGKVPEGLCDAVFKNIDQEEFGARALLIDAWTSSPQTNHPLRDVLRETAELKKLNGGLMKLPPLDDLLGDTYAAIWYEIGPSLDHVRQTRPSTPAPLPLIAPVASPPADRRSVMSLTNLMNVDGASETRAPPTPTPAPTPTPVSTILSIPDITLRPRARLISRREIVKRASDTIISKTSVPQKASPPPSKQTPARAVDPNVRVVIESRPTGASTPDIAKQEDEGFNESAMNSAPGSVHDDADDESELSEEEEEADVDAEAEAEVEAEAEAEAEGEVEGDEEEAAVVVVKPILFPNLKIGVKREITGDEEEDEQAREGEAEAVVEAVVGSGREDSDVVME